MFTFLGLFVSTLMNKLKDRKCFCIIMNYNKIFQHHAGDRGPGKRGPDTLLAPTLQHQTSTEDVENPSTQLVQVQLR